MNIYLGGHVLFCFVLGATCIYSVFRFIFLYRPLQSIEQSSSCLQCRRPGFNPWAGKILWRREWQSTPVLLTGEFNFFSRCGGFQVIYFFLSELWQFVSFKVFVHSHHVVKLISVKLFIIFLIILLISVLSIVISFLILVICVFCFS